MRTHDILINENTSQYLKKLVLMKQAGIELNPIQKKRLQESVSMVSPIAIHNRIVRAPQPIEEPKTFDELDMDDDVNFEEFDLDELIMKEILREMGYEEEEEEEEMEDIQGILDDEFYEILDELEII